MDCKFSTNGLAIDYFGTVKPCCAFQYDQKFQDQNNIKKLDLSQWHRSEKIISITDTLDQGHWPKECSICQQAEKNGRGDSMRLNAESSYRHYSSQDITLEIRGGSTCNLACQTCWPQASSRVAFFYQQSQIDFVPANNKDWDFNSLNNIKHRLRDIVLLGGEPFYDPRCLRFLQWLKQKQVSANLVIFTNGSMLDWEFLQNYSGKITIVFSIDAIGRPAEYIRFGSHWNTVQTNYEKCRALRGVETRVNITVSPYNYWYLKDLLTWLIEDWPDVVSFGSAWEHKNSQFMDESVFQIEYRQAIIESLEQTQSILRSGHIEHMQKINAVNALSAIIKQLNERPFDQNKYDHFRKFIAKMDRVKKINISDYCPEVAEYFDINPTRLDKHSPEFLDSER